MLVAIGSRGRGSSGQEGNAEEENGERLVGGGGHCSYSVILNCRFSILDKTLVTENWELRFITPRHKS